MTMTDPIADMLTRVRNALRVRRAEVSMPASRIKGGIADVLKREGFINDWRVEPDGQQGRLTLSLKYGPDGEMLINEIRRDSKPGRRLYTGAQEARRVLNGIGISIYTTPAGILSDRECRARNVGGERLATVW
ncbi:MAG TPA: 30S ribosomal protein S8 [Planctomycetota bacterium]|nr:30S ribosomal protein S8 [Planctomycetota bacterium]